ncbi:MAG: hypothetical protein WBA76_09440 [Phormidesmis sp.]
MGKQLGRMIAQVGFGAICGALSMTALGWEMLPAIARELPAWSYDPQTRLLNLTLPAGVTPTLSVIAPNQMLIELPDTQIGDVAGQNIGDGLVEGIMLEQTTSDKVWMVVDFASGTLLETEQTAVPIDAADSDPSAASTSWQQWQVRPAVIAGQPNNPNNSNNSDSVVGSVPLPTALPPAVSLPAPLPTLSVEAAVQASSAANLQSSGLEEGGAIAQAPDFPDLPVLKPAIPISTPVSVPPLNVAAPMPAQPALAETAPIESEQPIANLSTSDLPLEPPFIEELEEKINIPIANEPTPSETTAAASLPAVVPLPILDSEIASESTNETAVQNADEADSEISADESSEETANIALANAAPTPEAAPATVAPVAFIPVIDIPVIDIPVENASAPPKSRWPAPIPFGQPLP